MVTDVCWRGTVVATELSVVSVIVGGAGVGMGGREGGFMSAGNSEEIEGGFSSNSDGGGSFGAF